MLEVTDQAIEKLAEYKEHNNISSAFRVFLTQGGCSGPGLGLALDDEKSTDEVYQNTGITFVVEKSLMTQCSSIKVDFLNAGDRSGFSVSSANPISGAGCNPGSCGSGGCGC